MTVLCTIQAIVEIDHALESRIPQELAATAEELCDAIRTWLYEKGIMAHELNTRTESLGWHLVSNGEIEANVHRFRVAIQFKLSRKPAA